MWSIVRRFHEGPMTKTDWLRYATGPVFGLAIAIFLTMLKPQSWPDWTIIVLLWVIVLSVNLAIWQHRLAVVAFITIAALISVAIPSAAILGQAGDLANRARQGQQVHPDLVAGIPILDVVATPVTVEWVGPSAQRPVQLFGEKKAKRLQALLIGQGSNVVFLVVDLNGSMKSIRLPSNFVAVVDA